MARTVGIDLGTTNSVVSFIEGTRVEVVPNAEGSNLTPSVVLYKSDDEIIVGELARRQLVTRPEAVVRSIKRIIGKRYADLDEDILDNLPFRVAELDDGMAAVVVHGDILMRPEEVSADILEALRNTAEAFLGEEVTEAVITVPAHFNDQQRTATKAAAELVGITVQRIINEPTAAALAYGMGSERDGTVAVFDFGGGTFDISILNIAGDVFEVLSTNGDNYLGGDNIDERLHREICDEIVTQTGCDASQDATAVQRIREAAEKAKCELSTLKSTSISLPFIVADENGPKHYERELKREEFEEMTAGILERLLDPCRRALEDAQLGVADIDAVLLVGGSTRIPRVQKIVSDFFGKKPDTTVNPDEAVSAGAAIQSAVISGALREVLLLDVTPLTLGVELAGGVFKGLIERNSTIPCEASRKFTTVVDNQTSVVVHVLQGERLVAAENHSLARFRMTGIPAAPRELAEIEVHFSIDANGILAVDAVDLTSGAQTGVVIENYGQIGSRRRDVERMISAAEGALDEDRRYVQFAERRHRAELLQQRANRVIAAAADVMSDEDLKELKEEIFRLDLAMNALDNRKMLAHEERITELVEEYENNAELQRALRETVGAELEGSLRSPDTQFDEEDLPEGVRGSGQKRKMPLHPQKPRDTNPPDESFAELPPEEDVPPAEEELVDPRYEETPSQEEEEKPRQGGSGGPEKARRDFRDTAWEEGAGIEDADDDFDVSSMPPPPPA